ncbi:MAG: hypothetical protein LLF76_09750 [Planctomycetaceae bacterium]|nr:hypothetical protein [Planctomycetaceae bacterium]
MATRNRSIAVLFALIASMTIGALILMALDNYRPRAGAYSLSSYLRLDPIENVIKNTVQVTPAQWQRVEVYYSWTSGGNADDLGLLTQLGSGSKTEFHFVVCNGNGGENGCVQAGQLWKLQRACQNKDGVIRVCVISDGSIRSVTDSQAKRTVDLVESLSRVFQISSVRFPVNWEI